MKIYVWNAHWATLGGGEVYAAQLARTLANASYSVTILGNGPIPYKGIASRLGITLENIEYQRIRDESEIKDILRPEDVFINGSFGSNLRSPVAKSVYIVHFPHTRMRDFLRNVFDRLTPIEIRDESGKPTFVTGIYDLLVGSGSIRTHRSNVTVLTCMSGSLRITCSQMGDIELNPTQSYVLSNLESISIQQTSITSSVLRVESKKKSSKVLQLVSNFFRADSKFPESYRQLWANSKFTQGYIQSEWQKSSRLIYPPVKNFEQDKEMKSPYQIISVGRFISPKDGHCKNQLRLIEAFAQLCATSNETWKLYLCGGVDPNNKTYFDQVANLADKLNLDIQLMPNCSSTQLQELLGQSTYYWHATGMGIELNQPSKMEHFGITIVEAMNAGLIPMVYDIAGPSEILIDFPELRFKTIEELSLKTKWNSKMDPKETVELMEKLTLRAKVFSINSFEKNSLQAINDLDD